jgi:hypothetical protein
MTQAFNLSQLANNLNTTGQLDATDGLVNAVPVANGGTGASTIAAAVSNLSASIYPVGSIYINAGVTTNPATLLGFGTWSAFGAGRVLVGLNSGDSAFDTLQETGGSKDATVVSHTHTASTANAGAATGSITAQIGTDFGVFQTGSASGVFSVSGGSYPNRMQGAGGTGSRPTVDMSIPNHTHAVTIDTAGSSGTNANLQPYITVCMWLRTA